jgi:predicted GTPase
MVIRVLVFGRTGVGKSSLIKLLTGIQTIRTNQGFAGCTEVYKDFDFEDYKFFDTAGLNEPIGGTVPGKEAIEQLVKLLLSFREGLSLLIYVRTCEAFTQLDEANLKLMSHIIKKKIPSICINTFADYEENVNDWWTRSKMEFQRRVKEYLNFSDGCSVCCIDEIKNRSLTTLLEPFRNESKNLIWEKIRANKANEPVVILTEKDWIRNIVLDIIYWFKFKSWFSFLNKTENEIENEFKKELKSNGFETDNEIDEFVQKFYKDSYTCILS